MATVVLPFDGAVDTDVDVFSIQNTLQVGQSDKDISRVASIVGHGGICHGVHGDNGNGSGATPGVGTGVWGESDNGFGVYGASTTSAGVQGVSNRFDGVHGESQSSEHAGVSGINSRDGIGVFGQSAGNAGQFEGNVLVTGKLTVDADCSIGGLSFRQTLQQLQQALQQQQNSIIQLQNEIAALANKEQQDVNALYAAIQNP